MKKRFYLLLIVWMGAFSLLAQQLNFQSLYAHQAKSVYGVGEKIYSKLYIRQNNRLLMQLVNVYVDWYNAEGLLLEHQIYLAQKGGADIGFVIPKEYQFAFLRMRAYTLVSINQLPEFRYCDQVVAVYQSDVTQYIADSIATNQLHSPTESLSNGMLELKREFSSFEPKGKIAWSLINKTGDFINLSVSVLEEETYIPSTYSILKDFKVGNHGVVQKVPPYTDAFINVKGAFLTAPSELKNAMVSFSLIKRGTVPVIDEVPVTDSGTFLIDRLLLNDSGVLAIQLNTPKKQRQKLAMQFQQLGLFADAPTYVNDFGYALPGLQFQSPKARELASYIPAENEVVVYSTGKSPLQVLEDKYTTGLFKGGDAVSFNMMTPNAISFPNIFQFLRGKVAGLQISFDDQMNNGTGRPRLYWRSQQDTLKFFLNQMLVEMDVILTLNINEIAYVKVFRPPFLGAALGAPNGAIAVYTKQGDESNYIPKGSKLTQIPIRGFTSYQPFKGPQYTSEKQKSVIDRRKLLHWVSSIYLTQDQPEMKINYFNNDRSKRHKVIVEGVQQNGNLIRKEFILE